MGWADDWDEIQTVGSIDDGEAALAYRENGRILAVATLNRDRLSLLAERAMERGDDEALESLFRS